MLDITGRELKVGQSVAVPLSETELRTGKIVKITPKKVKVELAVISKTFFPKAVIIIDDNLTEVQKTQFLINSSETIINKSPKEVFENFLKENNLSEKDLEDFDYEENNYYEFELNDNFYSIEVI